MQIDPRDNVLVALAPLAAGEPVSFGGEMYIPISDIPAKHKFAMASLASGSAIIMYGGMVGRVREAIPKGGLLTTHNVQHATADFAAKQASFHWSAPEVSSWTARSFDGYVRPDGQVGTRNYWVVIPLVFCENRNVEALRDALEEELGYARPKLYRREVRELVARRRAAGLAGEESASPRERVFPNIDGIRFLLHQGGCGCTRQDARELCGLLAGYIHHPNVAGATVLSLGCQNAQVSILMEELHRRKADAQKPVLVFEQQKVGLESTLLSSAIRATFEGLEQADQLRRQRAPLSALTLGLECGGSDGFSGISANPALGRASDLLVAAGGRSILSEFPELCGVEQNLIDRCVREEDAGKFIRLMREYEERARAVHSSMAMNPSPGNIRDGLITDAIKSAGAARKGGTSPVCGVLDYPEYATAAGLNLQCTPGSDVESVTAEVGAGANVVVFTTGLGTPTGNPIAPVVKISTNSELAARMPDIIDLDTGAIVRGESTVEEIGAAILELVVRVASGQARTKAETLHQNDFIPWKRGVSL